MSAKISAAFVAAQAELTNPPKKSKANTGTYSYTYADLPSVIDHVGPVLAKHGLGVTQNITLHDGRVAVVTTLRHSSGESLEFGPLTGPGGGSWQQIGGGITYARRYALCAALGIAADEDMDVQVADSEPQHQQPTRLRSVAVKPTADAGMVKSWTARIAEAGDFPTLKAIGDEIAAHEIQPDTRKALLDAWTGRRAEVEA